MATRMWQVFPLSCLLACICSLSVGQESVTRIPTTDTFEFSESVLIGVTGKYAVTFDSNLFAGIERVKTKQGFKFRKHGATVTDCPDTIKVVIHGVRPRGLVNLPVKGTKHSPEEVRRKNAEMSNRRSQEVERATSAWQEAPTPLALKLPLL